MLRALVSAETGITFVTLGELLRRATIRQWGTNRRDSPRPATATERHLDRRLLPCLRSALATEHQGFPRLRRARRPSSYRHL